MQCAHKLYDGFVFFFKQKTAYEMRISDWSSDVCSSDLTISVWGRSLRSHREQEHVRSRECALPASIQYALPFLIQSDAEGCTIPSRHYLPPSGPAERPDRR